MKVFVTVPTYNERDNISDLIDDILRYTPECEIVIIDDNSPDGTHEIVRKKGKSDKRVHLLLRTKDRGRGLAGIAGFKYALAKEADFVVEMDGDFSHHPKYIPALLQAVQSSDVVLGSRFVPGGSDNDRPPLRKFITMLANTYIRTLLGLPIRDCNSGFRCFRSSVLKNVDLDHFVSSGPSIVQELLYKCRLMGYKITEIPIEFRDRKRGETKLTHKQLVQGLLMVFRLRLFVPRPGKPQEQSVE